ncbi:(-)-germacrene D synthase-like [Argentina anserina]|uniref:(-)-germacrene D synthase-like n=1 Tax=Argentina anserina TaxID=57926 RepID=UPI0021765179|nr:(-)-germacrene D synthase-like [Potentilla anserina]
MIRRTVKETLVEEGAAEDLSSVAMKVINLQRLGVSYHFEDEICEILQQIFDKDNVPHDDLHQNNSDLYAVALRFRLLRQQGHNVSCDKYFSNLKDNDGIFKESLISDTKGLLSLYEATHLRIKGDDILDQALTFTTTHLKSATRRDLSSPLLKQVTHALYQPLWKGIPRMEVRHYLSIYQEDDSHNETLLCFAKLDFNLLQQLYQKELFEITRWWKDVDFMKHLSFARDRVVECYLSALGVYFEPKYYFPRRTLSKFIYMVAVIDDMYDAHGTFEELELFNEAIQRWDISAKNQLPNYMKVCYQTLLDVYTELEEYLAREGNLYGIYYARESMKRHVGGYMKETRWFHSAYTPKLDEYMPLAALTSLYSLAIVAVVGMGNAATKDSLDWLLTDPPIVNASSVIGRLLNDVMSYQFEQKRGHNASSVELYVKEYGVTEEVAKLALTKQVDDAWKVINKAWLHPTRIPLPLLMRPLNLARVMEILYKFEDAFTNAGVELKNFATEVLIESVPIA